MSHLPEPTLAWAAFVPPRPTHPARRPRLDGVPVRGPGEANHHHPPLTPGPRCLTAIGPNIPTEELGK